MRIHGDIKVWVDGHKACARLYADGPEGPVIIHASAPLDPIRKLVARQFARRGIEVSGDDTAYKATVKRIGRRRALGRLRRMAPGAFKPGALGPYLAREELRRRRQARRSLGQTGLPVGAKRIGSLARAHRRRRRMRVHARRAQFLRALPRSPLALAMLPAVPGAIAAASAMRPSGSPGPSHGIEENSRATNPQAPSEEDGMDDESQSPAVEEDGAADPESETEPAESATPEADDDNDADQDDQEEGDEEIAGEDVKAARTELQRSAIARERVRSAMRLLDAARRSRAARRKVQAIVSLAGEGHPKATRALAALKTAHAVRKQVIARGRGTAGTKSTGALVPSRRPTTALARLETHALDTPPSAAPLAPPKPDEESKWWDILAPWRRGIG